MSDRMLRINEAVREVLSEAVQDLSDPRIGFLTITGVNVARDFRNAKVYISVLGPVESREPTLAALQSSQGLLQRVVARDVKLHHTPQLEFLYDDTLDSALRISELLESTDGDAQ